MRHSKVDILTDRRYSTQPLLIKVFDQQLKLCADLVRTLMPDRDAKTLQSWVVGIRPNAKPRVVSYTNGEDVTYSCSGEGVQFPSIPKTSHKMMLCWPDESGRIVGELHFSRKPKVPESALREVRGFLAAILYSVESTILVVRLRENIDDARSHVSSRQAVQASLVQLMQEAVRFLSAVAGGAPVLMVHFDFESWRKADGRGGTVVSSTPVRKPGGTRAFVKCLTSCLVDHCKSPGRGAVSAQGECLEEHHLTELQGFLAKMSLRGAAELPLRAVVFPIHRPSRMDREGFPYTAVVSFCAPTSEPVLREATRIFLREFHHLVLDADELFHGHRLEALLEDLTRMASLNEIARRVVGYLKKSFRASEVAVLQRRGDYLSIVRSEDVPEQSLPPLRIDDPKPQVCRVAKRQRPHYCPDVFAEAYLPMVKKTRSQYTIPLMQGNEVVGVLLIGLRVFDGLPEQHQRVVQAAASHCARSIAVTQRFVEDRTVARITADVLRRAVAELAPLSTTNASPAATAPDHAAVARLLESMLRYLADASESELSTKFTKDLPTVDLNMLVEQYMASPLWQALRGTETEPEFDRSSLPLPVLADPASVTRAIHELVMNAIEAVNAKPDRLVQLRCYEDTRRIGDRRIHCAVLDVKDNGGGYESGLEIDLFRSGYTTKSGHLGLGLPLALRTIKSFGGYIEAPLPAKRRRPDNVFSMWLPLKTRRAPGISET